MSERPRRSQFQRRTDIHDAIQPVGQLFVLWRAIDTSGLRRRARLSTSFREVDMVSGRLGRRAFVGSLVAFPFGEAAASAQTSSPPLAKVVAGSGGTNNIITLPGGDRIHVKVATQDSGGALFMTEQPIDRRGSGPPKKKTNGSTASLENTSSKS